MVSDVDVQVAPVVRASCRSAHFEAGFLGEEDGNGAGAGKLQQVLDPVDGTANFVKGIPLYSISLAVVNDKEPVLRRRRRKWLYLAGQC